MQILRPNTLAWQEANLTGSCNNARNKIVFKRTTTKRSINGIKEGDLFPLIIGNTIRELKRRRRQKRNWFILAKQHLYTCFALVYISLPLLHKYGVKPPNFKFSIWATWTQEKKSFSSPEIRYSLLNSIPEKFASISQIERDGIGANNSKLEPARIHFLCAVFATIAVVDVKAPHCLT